MRSTYRGKRKQRIERESRRALVAIGVALFIILSFGFLVWTISGHPHRHGRTWHWSKHGAD
jgi:hypothetical protein